MIVYFAGRVPVARASPPRWAIRRRQVCGGDLADQCRVSSRARTISANDNFIRILQAGARIRPASPGSARPGAVERRTTSGARDTSVERWPAWRRLRWGGGHSRRESPLAALRPAVAAGARSPAKRSSPARIGRPAGPAVAGQGRGGQSVQHVVPPGDVQLHLAHQSLAAAHLKRIKTLPLAQLGGMPRGGWPQSECFVRATEFGQHARAGPRNPAPDSTTPSSGTRAANRANAPSNSAGVAKQSK